MSQEHGHSAFSGRALPPAFAPNEGPRPSDLSPSPPPDASPPPRDAQPPPAAAAARQAGQTTAAQAWDSFFFPCRSQPRHARNAQTTDHSHSLRRICPVAIPNNTKTNKTTKTEPAYVPPPPQAAEFLPTYKVGKATLKWEKPLAQRAPSEIPGLEPTEWRKVNASLPSLEAMSPFMESLPP